MREIWVISDTHFGHENIIKYCNRPFSSVYDMNETMVENWNKTVKDEDHVWHLGDVYFTGGFQHEDENKSSVAWNFMKRLKGKKRLCLGNHDNGHNQLLLHFFEKIVLWRDWKELGLVMTHIPLHLSNIKEGRTNIHGHIHQNKSPDGPYRNVSVEQINYTPINIEELRTT